MQLEVRPASSDLETRPDVVGYTSVLLAREERRLLSPLDPNGLDSSDRERYEAKVRGYLRQLESAVYDRTDRLLGLRRVAPFRLLIANHGDELIQGAQVTVRLLVHGGPQLIQADVDEALLSELPTPPTPPSGVRARSGDLHSLSVRTRERHAARRVELSEQIVPAPQSLHHGLRNVVEPDSGVTISVDEHAIEIVYPDVDVRPGEVVQLPDVVLDLLEPVNVRCGAAWTVTARSLGGTVTGSFELFTVADPYALARTWPTEPTESPTFRSGSACHRNAPGNSTECEYASARPACGMLDDVNPLLVAAAGELPSTKLRLRLRDAVEEIRTLDDHALDDDPQVAVARLVAKYQVPVTEYRGDPVLLGGPRERREQVRDFPHPTRMVSRTVLDYTVAVEFDGDADIVRASLALCVHVPQWEVQGSQIRTVFTTDPTAPAGKLELQIRERVTDAATHLSNARPDLDRYHHELNKVLEDLVPKLVAVRLAGQRQREELPFRVVAAPDNGPPRGPRAAAAPATASTAPDADPDLLFRQVLDALEPAATTLAAHTPLVNALRTEELLRDQLMVFLTGRLPAPFDFTAETFHGQGKVDIAIRWHDQLVGIIECKVWHSEPKFREGIDQLLSYLTYKDTRAAYVVFIKQQNVTQIVDVLKQAMLGHDNCSDTNMPSGADRVSFAFHATGDPARPITMVLMPMPLATSATGSSTGRGLRVGRAAPDEGNEDWG